MAGGVADRDRPAEAGSPEDGLLETKVIDQCFEVAQQGAEVRRRHIPIRESHASVVVADDAGISGQRFEEVAERQVLPAKLDVGDPAPLEHDRLAGADLGPGEPDVVLR